jgi:hypothetical protein
VAKVVLLCVILVAIVIASKIPTSPRQGSGPSLIIFSLVQARSLAQAFIVGVVSFAQVEPSTPYRGPSRAASTP